ncbi:MAG TPA: TrkH family potassium uptake protein [Bacteroidales bacterium]|nr:TrkH family potassium uptake protein [Bacteroidales bacterium]
MFNLRIIARIFSLLLIVEGFFMLLSAAVAFIYNEPVKPFLFSAIVTIIAGVIVYTPMKEEERVTGKKEGYIIITGVWILFALFGTLPYMFSKSVNNFSSAFFESMSGFTTTGSTVFRNVESLNHGILFWRSLTQWVGGMGMIFISLYVLPLFRSIYIQLPASEFAGQPADKIHPRIKDTAKRLLIIYAILTLAETLLLFAGGTPIFDAVCISFSTLSTGGFSTTNNSFTPFASPFLIIILTIFMFTAGLNMTFIYFGLKRNFKKIAGNNELIFYTLHCAVFMIIASVVFSFQKGFNPSRAVLEGSFHVVSVITTTGFYINDHGLWGQIMIIILFMLMFSGGTAGSPSGGIKIVRLLLVTRNSRQEFIRLLHPNAFIPVRLDKKTVAQSTIFNLLVFISLYAIIVCVSALMISFMGYDIVESFSTSASMLANIGPTLGSMGPSTDFSTMPEAGKWFLSALMLLGRLEMLTVMVLFTRSFYRR